MTSPARRKVGGCRVTAHCEPGRVRPGPPPEPSPLTGRAFAPGSFSCAPDDFQERAIHSDEGSGSNEPKEPIYQLCKQSQYRPLWPVMVDRVVVGAQFIDGIMIADVYAQNYTILALQIDVGYHLKLVRSWSALLRRSGFSELFLSFFGRKTHA